MPYSMPVNHAHSEHVARRTPLVEPPIGWGHGSDADRPGRAESSAAAAGRPKQGATGPRL